MKPSKPELSPSARSLHSSTFLPIWPRGAEDAALERRRKRGQDVRRTLTHTGMAKSLPALRAAHACMAAGNTRRGGSSDQFAMQQGLEQGLAGTTTAAAPNKKIQQKWLRALILKMDIFSPMILLYSLRNLYAAKHLGAGSAAPLLLRPFLMFGGFCKEKRRPAISPAAPLLVITRS